MAVEFCFSILFSYFLLLIRLFFLILSLPLSLTLFSALHLPTLLFSPSSLMPDSYQGLLKPYNFVECLLCCPYQSNTNQQLGSGLAMPRIMKTVFKAFVF